MKTNKFTLLLMIAMSFAFMTLMASCQSQSGRKAEQSVVVKPMVDANLYEGVITKLDSINTEYSVYVYAMDKWDAERIITLKYIDKEQVECNLRIVLIQPINIPFKYQSDSALVKAISQAIPNHIIKWDGKHNELAKGPKKAGKKSGGKRGRPSKKSCNSDDFQFVVDDTLIV
jgi:hypothetical protein